MKRNITIIIIALLAFGGKTFAQENLIKGGAMETDDVEFWKTTTLETDPANSSEFSFGYTEATPTGGTDGCLHYSITNTGANGAHLMFYQEVSIEKGKAYTFDFQAKALQEMNNSWLEVYIGETEPVDGADYGSGTTALGGFKWADWAEGCDNLFDGTLQANGCLEGSQGTFTIEGEGEATMYIGFKAGIWAAETSIEFVVDNVSLVKSATTAVAIELANTTLIFPNPVNEQLNIQSINNITNATIFNVVGQKVVSISDVSNTINVSELNPGVYVIELTDNTNNKAFHRFQKN